MPTVKVEEIDIRAVPRDNPNPPSSSISIHPNDDRRPRQYAFDRNARIHANASPYPTDGRFQRNMLATYRQEPVVRLDFSYLAIRLSTFRGRYNPIPPF